MTAAERQAVRANTPFLPLGKPSPLFITAKDFEPRESVAGQLSPIGVYRVPKDTIIQLDTMQPIRLQFVSSFEIDETTTASGATISIVHDAALEIPRDAEAMPGKYFYAAVRRKVDAVPAAEGVEGQPESLGELEVHRATSYAPKTRRVTFGGLQSDTNYIGQVNAIVNNGVFELQATVPAGVNQRSYNLYNSTIQAINETDQAAGETALTLNRGAGRYAVLGPQFGLEILVDSDVPMSITKGAGTIVMLPGLAMPIQVRDLRALNEGLSLGLS